MKLRVTSTAAALLAVVLLTLPKAALAENEPGGRPASLVQVDAVISEPFGQTAPVIGRLVSRQAGVLSLIHI